MKPTEFLFNYYIEIEQDYGGVEDVAIYEKKSPMLEFNQFELGCLLGEKMDLKFIDKDDLINIDAGTCLGLEVFKIQMIIDFFRKENFNPYEWEEFKKELERRRLR